MSPCGNCSIMTFEDKNSCFQKHRQGNRFRSASGKSDKSNSVYIFVLRVKIIKPKIVSSNLIMVGKFQWN